MRGAASESEPPVADRARVAALVEELGVDKGSGYRVLAGHLRDAIASGALPVGSRLPPQRELAASLSVGRTTVVAAYNLLRADSLIEMRQGAGTWVTEGRRPAGRSA